MAATDSPVSAIDPVAVLAGGGEMGERTRAFDWSSTALGPVANWPQSLKTAVSICLGSRYPIVIWWGRETLTQIYNDGYISFLGAAKHPAGLGQSAREAWREIWHILEPMFEGVFKTGEATWSENFLYVVNRKLPREEAYFTFSYSPIRDDTGTVAGIFCACDETTSRVLGERRLRTLRDIGRTVLEAKSAEEACKVTARTLAENPNDIPFALVYLLDGDARYAHLVASTGVQAGDHAACAKIDLRERADRATWPLRDVFETGTAKHLFDPAARVGPLPGGPWPESPDSALILPIAAHGYVRPAGFIVIGLSPRLVLDAEYRSFLDLLSGQVATAIANARAYEEERNRAAALAEIDRAKTLFFSNVSHEFRTPLTLILGPLDDALAQTTDSVQRERLELMQRNALRLQKLVNTLLDFSRLEAGRMRASFEPTDLAALTMELASTFRSAIESAGMRLRADCLPLREPVYVDREMWEKIVLNLLSNAFKFTLQGEIAISLRDHGEVVQLTVSDTGSGIAADQLPHIFERFHRVEGTRARTHEGSGIGLAFVHELVKLHGGEVHVDSVLEKGTTFTITIPRRARRPGAPHIAPHHTVASATPLTNDYVEEARRWLPQPTVTTKQKSTSRFRIVWADDNADMRDYVGRLLSDRYDVEAVPDGAAALNAVRRELPDLVLADVMMPVLDGFGLLREVRADERTRDVPVILLSARAGEESQVEGLEAGADDYLIKPFSARELLARVESHLQMARLRHESSKSLQAQETELREAQRLAHVGSWRWDAATDTTIGSDELFHIFGLDPEAQAFPNFKDQDGSLYPHESWQRINDAARQTLQTGVGYELEVNAFRRGEPICITARSEAVRDVHGKVVGLRGTVQDITEHKLAERALKHADRQKDEFLATLAHELRNPLAPLRNGLQIMKLAEGDAAAVRKARSMMERQLGQMAHLIDDLMDLSRISMGRIVLQKKRLRLSDAIHDAVDLSRPLLDEEGHAFVLDEPQEPIYVEGDRTRLAQVFANLLNNAAKYTDRNGCIRVLVERQGREVVATVEDNGIGIAAPMLSKVFDMFTQVDRSLEQSRGGLGIGLNIVKRLVEMHDGVITAESDGPGTGSRFVVRLPIAVGVDTGSTEDGGHDSVGAVSRRRILVADDNWDTASSLAVLLDMMGNETATAHDGREALEVGASFKPDVVLLDIGMPELNGLDVCRRIREEPWGKDIVIVACTGWGQEDDRRKSSEAGFDHHLVKPVDYAVLMKLLTSV